VLRPRSSHPPAISIFDRRVHISPLRLVRLGTRSVSAVIMQSPDDDIMFPITPASDRVPARSAGPSQVVDV